MRKLSYCFCLVLVCGLASAQANPASSNPGKPPALFLKAQGPERLVDRYSRFLDIAVNDYGVHRVSDPRQADFVIGIKITENKYPKEISAGLLLADFSLRDGSRVNLDFCTSVNVKDRHLKEPPIPVVVPVGWKKLPRGSAIFMDPAKQPSVYLAETVKDALTRAGYRIVEDRKEAEAELVAIEEQTEVIKFVVNEQLVATEIEKLGFASNLARVLDRSVEMPVNPRAQVCKSAAEKFYKPDVEQQRDSFWTSAQLAVGIIAEGIDRFLHTSNQDK